ncbi:sporulation protein YpjB [Siminovitchia sediminis]|uniref:Sporulation protein YpjB n=1 Tax=Siminovitchia sediminis TaxID=1274353 RepID=A0ABW4KK40_9BACI
MNFRFSSNAISSTHQPLWVKMKTSVMKDFREMKSAALEGNRDAYNQSLNAFFPLTQSIMCNRLI